MVWKRTQRCSVISWCRLQFKAAPALPVIVRSGRSFVGLCRVVDAHEKRQFHFRPAHYAECEI
jgi:hypothetical protein